MVIPIFLFLLKFTQAVQGLVLCGYCHRIVFRIPIDSAEHFWYCGHFHNANP